MEPHALIQRMKPGQDDTDCEKGKEGQLPRGRLDKGNPGIIMDTNRNQSSPHQLSSTFQTLTTENQHLTDVQRFYSGSNVFITGGTGFMGKVLIEKLLRSCPDVRTVYVMVREKKGKGLVERIDNLFSSPCFNRIKQECSDFRSKVKFISGDISQEGLGINEEDRILLQQEVNIVFHVAATVRFDEHLKYAILQNVRGTRELLNLCKTCTKLKSVVHVSTAYSNCPEKHIKECIYPSPLNSDQAIRLAETHDVNTIDRLSHKLVGEWPNTYSYTKALSEDVVKSFERELPLAILRPAIVVCTNAEPMPGWIDNLYGPSGCLVACAAGLLRTMRVKGSMEANVVPCDMSINAILVSAWDSAENKRGEEVSVYNYASPTYNSMSWNRYMHLFMQYGVDYPPSKVLWYPTMTMVNNKVLYFLVRLLLHFLPALLMDFGFLVTGRNPQMVKVYSKIHRFTDVISYFCTNQWRFEIGNVEGMWQRLSEVDRRLFFFNMDDLDWARYVQKTCSGLRTYLLKDPEDTLPKARLQWQWFYYLHCGLRLIVLLIKFYVLQVVLHLIATGLQHIKWKLGTIWDDYF